LRFFYWFIVAGMLTVFIDAGLNSAKTNRVADNRDTFLNRCQPGISAILLSPQMKENAGHPQRSPLFLPRGASLEIIATGVDNAADVSGIEIKINKKSIMHTTADTIRYLFTSNGDTQGANAIDIIVQNTNGKRDTTGLFIISNPPVIEQPLSEGIREGITYLNDHSVILTLFAPYKDFVYVIGDFNDWEIETSYYMHRHPVDADSVYWWLQIDQLPAGQEYAFQYLVDGALRIADPYTEKVLDPWHDQYISNETYPGLRPYPVNKTTEPVSLFRTEQTSFNWKYSDAFKPAAQEQLVIYELLVRDFIRAHDYKTLIDTLSYFEKLGINAIELMPVNEFEGNLSWGYNPSFYFTPDKYYGPADDLRRFVDACHHKGIAVILDMVLNHSYGQSPLVRLYFDNRTGRPSAQNPWYNVTSPNTAYAWGYDFDHTSKATQKFVDRVTQYWLEVYQIDGFRFDFTKGFTNTPGDGWAYDTRRIAILKRIADKIWNVNPDAYIILEHFTDNREERELASYKRGMMIWGNMNDNYNEATMGYHADGKSDISWGYYGNRGWPKANLITYMESHDEERLMYKNLQYGNSYGGYTIQDSSTALERMKLAAAFFFTYPGPKMVWQFGELGYDYSINYNERTGEKPIRWDYYSKSRLRKQLFSAFAALIKLRTKHAAFYSAASQVSMDVSGPLKRIKLTHPDMNALIIGNFDVVQERINPQFHHDHIWYDYLSGDSLTSIPSSILLQPGEFHIYTDVKVEKQSDGGMEIPASFFLAQNYPNPFNSETFIRYQLQEKANVKLEIYNLSGGRIATLVKKEQPAGNYQMRWQGLNEQGVPVASGIYIYRLQCRQFTEAHKMILVR
jgi:1,4-alpha-glucan branching enzyme